MTSNTANKLGWFFVGVAMFFLFKAVTHASEASYDLRVDAPSQFWFRGMQAEPNFVLQPCLTVSKDDLSGCVWSNYNTVTGQDDEVDAGVNISRTIGKVQATFGFQGYFIQSVYNTFDFNLLLSADDFNLLQAYDFSHRNGLYEELSFTPKVKAFSSDVSVTVALAANVHYQRTNSGFSHAYISLAWPIPAGSLKIIPSIYHQEPLSSDISAGTVGEVSLDLGL